MPSTSVRAAAAVALALGALCAASANAASVSLEGGYAYNESWGGMMPTTTYDQDNHVLSVPGGKFGGAAYSDFSYDLTLSLTSPFTGNPAADNVTAPYSGTYTIYNAGTPVSTGTVTATGKIRFDSFEEYAENPDTGAWEPTGNYEYAPRGYDFAGQFLPTTGSILSFNPGPVTFTGELGFDGFAFFWGQLSDARTPNTNNPAPVPLPAAAPAGLALLALSASRRRRRTT